MKSNGAVMPSAYKQTELGWIPAAWEVKALRDFARIETGSTPPTADPSNYGDEHLFVGPGDLGATKWITRTEKRLSAKGFVASRRFPQGSVLFVCIGSTIGKCGIASTELTSNQQINAIFPGCNFSSEFLYYALSAAAPRVRALAGEQAVPMINKSGFAETKVALPPVEEQRAIAGALSDTDAVIEGLDRLIAKKRDLKQAAMQQLLTGQIRLPGFGGSWKLRKLGEDIADLLAGVSVNSTVGDADAALSGPAVLKTSAVANGEFMPWEAKTIAAADIHRVQLTPVAETVLISRMNTPDLVGECGYVGADHPNLFVPDRLWMTRFRSGAQLSARWLAFLLCTPAARLLVKNIATGTSGSMKNISKTAFLNLEFNIPELHEQIAISVALADMHREIAALEVQRDKTRTLRQAMMQELLTGRIRLI